MDSNNCTKNLNSSKKRGKVFKMAGNKTAVYISVVLDEGKSETILSDVKEIRKFITLKEQVFNFYIV